MAKRTVSAPPPAPEAPPVAVQQGEHTDFNQIQPPAPQEYDTAKLDALQAMLDSADKASEDNGDGDGEFEAANIVYPENGTVLTEPETFVDTDDKGTLEVDGVQTSPPARMMFGFQHFVAALQELPPRDPGTEGKIDANVLYMKHSLICGIHNHGPFATCTCGVGFTLYDMLAEIYTELALHEAIDYVARADANVHAIPVPQVFDMERRDAFDHATDWFKVWRHLDFNARAKVSEHVSRLMTENAKSPAQRTLHGHIDDLRSPY